MLMLLFTNGNHIYFSQETTEVIFVLFLKIFVSSPLLDFETLKHKERLQFNINTNHSFLFILYNVQICFKILIIMAVFRNGNMTLFRQNKSTF